MTAASLPDGEAAARARAWRDALHASVCDVLEPWAHGTVVRATSRPTYWDFNVVRVEEDPAMSVAELAAFADQALAGLAHRRVDFDLVNAAEPLRLGFEAQGWRATRLLWMRHEASAPPGPDVAVEELPYDAVHDLRLAWHHEDFPDQDPGRVSVGSRVSFRDRESNEVTEVTVVHRLEADVAAGKLSVESPVAKALLGARAGEDVTVDAPNGTKQLTILDVG